LYILDYRDKYSLGFPSVQGYVKDILMKCNHLAQFTIIKVSIIYILFIIIYYIDYSLYTLQYIYMKRGETIKIKFLDFLYLLRHLASSSET
jgi:hypothetical protein